MQITHRLDWSADRGTAEATDRGTRYSVSGGSGSWFMFAEHARSASRRRAAGRPSLLRSAGPFRTRVAAVLAAEDMAGEVYAADASDRWALCNAHTTSGSLCGNLHASCPAHPTR